MMNKMKHLSVKYRDDKDMPKVLRDPMYRKMEEVGNCYEVSMAKKKVIWDLPNIVAFFVYGYAKLNLLS